MPRKGLSKELVGLTSVVGVARCWLVVVLRHRTLGRVVRETVRRRLRDDAVSGAIVCYGEGSREERRDGGCWMELRFWRISARFEIYGF
jgi:hypothetical protein